jgi:hypothetical protein
MTLFDGVIAIIVFMGIILFIWSKMTGKPIGKIIKELMSSDG